jgi:hypothetical protein
VSNRWIWFSERLQKPTLTLMHSVEKQLVSNWAEFVQCSGSQPVAHVPFGVRETSSG